MKNKTAVPINGVISIDACMAAAEHKTGLHDFGDLDFLSRARRWLNYVASEGQVSQAGKDNLEGLITGWMVNRLQFEADVKKHPEILEETVRAPIFVTGMPRTGTTKLQRVLASNPAMQCLPFWLILNMAPVPGGGPAKPDPRIAIAEGYVDILAKNFPDFMTAHPAFVEEPEEESLWMEADFQSLANCTRARAPSYLREIIDSKTFESYPFLKRALQYVQWQRGESGRRPWVLKAPNHIGNLASLYEVFPDAMVVHTYRDPVVALPSTCRIVEVFRGMTTDTIDPYEIGQDQLAVWSEMQKRHLQQRDDDRMVDVHYDDINENVLAVVGKIYARRGIELDSSTRQLMQNWESNYPQHQFGKHTYSLERYGLSKQVIESAFADYIQRFGR